MSLKSYLESLEIGDSKIKLSDEQIKRVLKESGTVVETETNKVKEALQKDIDSYKATINDLKDQIEKTPKTDDYNALKTKIAEYEQAEQKRKEAEETAKKDAILTNNILEAIKDKKFVNDYTKNSIISEIKKGLSDSNNAGKSAKDIFEALVKDRTDIFENPNKITDIPGASQNNIGDKTLDNANQGIKLNSMFRRF